MRCRLLALAICSFVVAVSAHLDTALAAPQLPVPPESLPSAFDLREVNRVTPAKSPLCGTCWTAAAMGSLESFLMPFENWDFSEDHMQIFINGINSCHEGGANAEVTTSYFAGWYGPVKETDFDYTLDAPQIPDVQKHVQLVYYLPEKPENPELTDLSWTKYAIMNLGAVYHPVNMTLAPINNTQYNTSYHPNIIANHAVALVGWDDKFPAYKFTYTYKGETITPKGPGAFIAKSNGGPTFGDNGYYYISYYDGAIWNLSGYVFTAEPKNNYSRIYQYDAAGDQGQGFFRRGGNVFVAEATEDLAAVSFYGDIGPGMDQDYLVEIYIEPDAGSAVNSGLPKVSFKTTLPMAGYYTVKLPQKVRIYEGQSFAVVLSNPNIDVWHYFKLDIPMPWQPAAQKGRGFIELSDGWHDIVDYKNGQACSLAIKAFTTKPLPIWMTAVRRFGPDIYRLAWDFTNTTQSTLQVKPVAYLYKQGQTGFQRMAGEVFGEYYLNDSGRKVKMENGILQMRPNETVTVISRPGINDQVQKVASNTYTLQSGMFQLIDNWRFFDLFKHPISVVSTIPSMNAVVYQEDMLRTVTIDFDAEIRPGPNLAGITVMSPDEKKFTFNTTSGKTLTIMSSSAFGLAGIIGGPEALWTVTVPRDAVQDVFGNRMERDFTLDFTVKDQSGFYD